MILVIQTNIPGMLHVWVSSNKKMLHRQQVVSHHGSSRVLALVNTTVVRAGGWSNVEKIMVVNGPGAFTAVRTGIVVANTLADVLGCLIRGIRSDVVLDDTQLERMLKTRSGWSHLSVRPFYGREPNITRAPARLKLGTGLRVPGVATTKRR